MVIFVCGVVTGALVVRTQGLRNPSASNSAGGFGAGMPGPGLVRDFMRRLDQAHLDLTPDEHEKIEKIMQDSQTTNAAIRTRIAPQLQAEKERAQKAINQLLNPMQQQKFAELLKKPEPRQEPRGGNRVEGRGPRGGEGPGFRGPRSTNRPPTNGYPEDGRGRTNRTGAGNNLTTNGIPTNLELLRARTLYDFTNNLATNAIPPSRMPTNIFLTNNVPTNGP